MSTMTRTRLTAAERTEQLVSAAITAFSSSGYTGTSTDDIARLAGVSQPYVIRLFGSKQRLFLAGFAHAAQQIEQAFRDSGATTLETLGDAYRTLLDRRELLGMLLHGFAASADPTIGDVVRKSFGAIYDQIRTQTDTTPEEASQFVATGMLLTVLSAMRVVGPEPVPPTPWMTELVEVYPKLCGGTQTTP
jgi:AcrR family transcriptional regulator